MLGEIFHFGVVMGVILVGFAVSFIALLLENTTTFAYVLVSVFHAMLGEVDVFDEFEFVYRFWATLLIVVYLIIMSIMMLNLLIAVLSTEHAKVDERSESEYSVSKVRMIKLYRRVVDLDLLPPPLNLVQLAIVFPFFLAGSIFDLQNWRIVQHAVGVTIFWAVMGPIVVILGSLLWVVSIPRAIAIAWEGTTFVGYSRLFRVLLCCAIAPFYLFGICGVLLMLWLQSAALGLCDALRRPKGKDTPHDANSTSPESWTSRQDDEASVSKMLRNALNGLDVRDIWDYLKDPTTPTSPAMRREEQYRPATVEQIRYVKNDLDTVKKMLLSPFVGVDVSKTSRVGMKCQYEA